MKQIRYKKSIIHSLILVLSLVFYSGTASSSCEDSYDSSHHVPNYRINKVLDQIAKERKYRAILEKKKAGKLLKPREKAILARGFSNDSTGVENRNMYGEREQKEQEQKKRENLMNYFDNKRRFIRGTTPLEREFYKSFREIDPELFPDNNY